jgi:hypothetical protein
MGKILIKVLTKKQGGKKKHYKRIINGKID